MSVLQPITAPSSLWGHDVNALVKLLVLTLSAQSSVGKLPSMAQLFPLCLWQH